MLFNLERDDGSSMIGYVVPDGFRSRAELSVTLDGREMARFVTAQPRDSVVQAGRHESGLCGFTLDDALVPGLSLAREVSVHDVASRLLVARRCPPGVGLPRRVLRLETHLLPLARLDAALAPRFAYAYPAVERRGRETATQVFMLNDGGSLYVSARLPMRGLQSLLDPAMSTLVVLRDPRRELAERLLVLNRVAVSGYDLLAERDSLVLEPAIAYAGSLDFSTSSTLRRALKAMPARVRSLLADPVTRLLAGPESGEPVRPATLAPALRTLSRFGVVALREHWDEARALIGCALGIDPQALPEPQELRAVETLAAEIADCPALDDVIAIDLELYAHVVSAFQATLAPGPEMAA